MGRQQRISAHLRCRRSSAKPLFVHGSGSKGMSLNLRMVVCLGVLLNIQDMWVVAKRATRDTESEHMYGVGLEDEDEDLDRLSKVASSSSSDLRTPLAPSSPVTQVTSSKSSNPALQLVFSYDIDKAVLKAIERCRLQVDCC